MAVMVSRLPRKVRANISKVLGLPAPGKYGNTKVRCDGHKFDSLKERDRYLVLLMHQKMGEISGLKVHPKFNFEINGQKIGTYTADFSYMKISGIGLEKEANLVVEDVKSEPTRKARAYRRNLKLMKAIHEIQVKEVI